MKLSVSYCSLAHRKFALNFLMTPTRKVLLTASRHSTGKIFFGGCAPRPCPGVGDRNQGCPAHCMSPPLMHVVPVVALQLLASFSHSSYRLPPCHDMIRHRGSCTDKHVTSEVAPEYIGKIWMIVTACICGQKHAWCSGDMCSDCAAHKWSNAAGLCG
mgnify:CR=1 FL=1